MQQAQLFARERESHRARKRFYFRRNETQLLYPQFAQVIARPQARQRQRRINACPDKQVQARGQMVKQEVQRGMDRVCRDEMIVIQDHDRILREQTRQIVEGTDQCMLVVVRVP